MTDMTEETKPIEAEVLSIEPKPPRFDLRQAKTASYNEKVTEIMSRTSLERWQVEGVLADCVMQKGSKDSQANIAQRWGVGFGQVTTCRFMGKLTIDECRASLGTKSIIVSNKATDMMMDALTAGDVKTAKDLLPIAKGMTDNALNLENKSVGGNVNQVNSVGDVSILIQLQADRQKQGGGDAMARLLAKGINPAALEKVTE